jgi:hypothetical protein
MISPTIPSRLRRALASLATLVLLSVATTTTTYGSFVVFEAAGPDAAAIASTRDAFRAAIGGGAVVGANGSFGGLRREINWDATPEPFSDPNLMPGNFFNVNSPRGVVLSTPGTGFLVSANAGGGTPVLFGFGSDFQAFSAQKLFTAVNSNVTDVNFFTPGTNIAATTNAFGLVFTDVEIAGLTKIEFFDENDSLIFTHDAMVAGNQGLTFLGGIADSGEQISRVRITSGLNTIVSNGALGNPNDDVVVMDDFIYGEPVSVPEPASLTLTGLGFVLIGTLARRSRRRRQHAN